jgi:hypothetical protein
MRGAQHLGTQRGLAITELETMESPHQASSTISRTRARSIDPAAKKQSYYLGPAQQVIITSSLQQPSMQAAHLPQSL